jgi:2-keto-4-pentenoate hydratase
MNDARTRARKLYEARRTCKPIPPFTDDEPGLGMDDAYLIQQELVAMLLADGDRIIGYKAGLTSEPMQQMFGINSPDYGPVLASTVVANGGTLPMETFIAPQAEAEIVFRLRSQLAGPGVTPEQARSAIGEAMAGIEIVDSRIDGWRIKPADTIADLASNGAMTVGNSIVLPPGVDPRLIGCVLSHNGSTVATGVGAVALGNPVTVVAWLANTLGKHGTTLEAGQLIMTGALHAAIPISPGDEFIAEFDRLGPVSIRASDRS